MKRSKTQNVPVELLGIAAMNPMALTDSSARQEMLGSHLSQSPVIEGRTTRRCSSGVEREFGHGTFSTKFPATSEIERVIDKYPQGRGSKVRSPLTAIIYTNKETNEVDVLESRSHHCLHNHFGFKFQKTAEYMRVMRGSVFKKHDIIADSPSKDERGNWMPGAEIPCAFMQLTGIIEDGVIADDTARDILTVTGIEARSGTWGKKRFPLNVNGTREEYKPIPDLGDTIRSDGLLFIFREYDPMLAAVNMAEDMLRTPDYAFDHPTYAHAGATVVDIEARMGESLESSHTPIGMERQVLKYHTKEAEFYDEIIRATRELCGSKGSNRKLGDKLHILEREGLVFKNSDRKRVKQMYNMRPLEDWRINVTFEYKMRPGVGSKITCFHGGKGVICSCWKDEDMPKDKFGRTAHLIMDGNSTVKRMNPGRFYEQYYNAQGDQLQRELIALKEEMGGGPAFIDEAWDRCQAFYDMVTPRMVEKLNDPRYKGSKRHHVENVIKNSSTLWLPTQSPRTLLDATRLLMKHRPLDKGPVTFTSPEGETITTENNVIIASIYIMALEKSGDDRSAVSSARLNHFGLPGKVNQANKYSSLIRESAIRPMGTAEVRNLCAFVGGDMTAEMLEASASPTLHKHQVDNILASATPFAEESVITDFSLVGVGGRSQDFFLSAMEASGVSFYRQDAHLDDGIVYKPKDNENAL